MGFSLHRNYDAQWEAHEKRLKEKEDEFKGKGTMPDHKKWQDGEWARWLAVEKNLIELAKNIPAERKAMMLSVATTVITESYEPPEGKEKPSSKAVAEVADMIATYCYAFKRMPGEYNLYDEAEQERIMENNAMEWERWPPMLVPPPSGYDDKWEIFLQQLYLHLLRTDGFDDGWVQCNFADLYYLTLNPKRFSVALTYLIDLNTNRLIAMKELYDQMSPNFKRSHVISEWKRKYDIHAEHTNPDCKSTLDGMEGYTSDFKPLRPLLEGPDKQELRKTFYWFVKDWECRYTNPDLVWETLDIQKAILESKETTKLVTIVTTGVYKKMADKQQKINENYNKLYANGRQALEMNLDQI